MLGQMGETEGSNRIEDGAIGQEKSDDCCGSSIIYTFRGIDKEIAAAKLMPRPNGLRHA
jgi:hypothetical protein